MTAPRLLAVLAGLTAFFAAPAFAAPAAGEEPSFKDFLKSFRKDAVAAGVSAAVYDRETKDLDVVQKVFDLNDQQPEFNRAVWDYIDGVVSPTRVATGRQKFADNAVTLGTISARYHVDPALIAGVWGLESSYGAITGNFDAVSALATLAWRGRRESYGRTQLIGALKIIEAGYATRDMLKGSWAGALGQTQFVPTTYIHYAIDEDGDGKRDIWNDLPDVFASTANYLSVSGARDDEPWGMEVVLPQGFDYALADVEVKKALVEWSGLGVKGAAGALLDGGRDPNLRGRILLPAGAEGPAFLVFSNFEAVLRYNNSTSYALGVGLLSDAIAGRATPIVGAWPRDDRPLSSDERKALQQALKDHGFDPGPIDGVLGAATRKALRAWQISHGLPADGYASAATLLQLTLPTAPAEAATGPASSGESDDSGATK